MICYIVQTMPEDRISTKLSKMQIINAQTLKVLAIFSKLAEFQPKLSRIRYLIYLITSTGIHSIYHIISFAYLKLKQTKVTVGILKNETSRRHRIYQIFSVDELKMTVENIKMGNASGFDGMHNDSLLISVHMMALSLYFSDTLRTDVSISTCI